MCVPVDALPPDPPFDLAPISGGAGGEDVILRSRDGAEFRGYLARAASPSDAGVVIGPDVRGLIRFYEQLAERFAEVGINAIAIDYFGRTAGPARRPDGFDFKPHVDRTTPDGVQDDFAAAAAHLKIATGASRVFVLGFCMGGRAAFLASRQRDLAGVVAFYGRLNRRDNDIGPTPLEAAPSMHAPILGLFGGDDHSIAVEEIAALGEALAVQGVAHEFVSYPGAPHSFFDRTFNHYQEACDDAWRRVVAFSRTGQPRPER